MTRGPNANISYFIRQTLHVNTNGVTFLWQRIFVAFSPPWRESSTKTIRINFEVVQFVEKLRILSLKWYEISSKGKKAVFLPKKNINLIGFILLQGLKHLISLKAVPQNNVSLNFKMWFYLLIYNIKMYRSTFAR